jgi:hypothetical protein
MNPEWLCCDTTLLLSKGHIPAEAANLSQIFDSAGIERL